MNTQTTILSVLMVTLLLAAAAAAHAQNEIIPNPDAVKLRRVWMVRGSTAGGEKIGSAAGIIGDINHDSIMDFASFAGQRETWDIYFGGPNISTTPNINLSMSILQPRYPVVGNFWGSGILGVVFPEVQHVDTGIGYNFIRYPLYRVEGDSVFIAPALRLEPSRTTGTDLQVAVTGMFAVDLDRDGDDELILVVKGSLVNLRRSTRAEVWIFDGGPNFQLDTPTVVLKDPDANYDTYYASVADIDGDGFPDIITGGIYVGQPNPVKLNFWWGNNDIHALSVHPDRTLQFTDPDYPRLGYGITTLDCDGDHVADLWFPGPDGQYLFRMGIPSKNPRTRPLTLADADGVYGGYAMHLPLGYLNDSLHRYAVSGGTAADPSGVGTRLVGLSGGADGPNHSYDAYYPPEFEGNVFQYGGPLGDATGDGWDDYLTANPSWYPPYEPGIAILLAGGPYIPTDDATVSVREVAVVGRTAALHIWPNPVTDLLHVAWRGDLKPMPARMSVHDINGRLVAEGDVTPSRGEALWRCAGVAAGTYLLTIYDGSGSIIALEKLVKE